ncbi:MAG: GNAT family N-acetyltransferase [Acidobacteria bacterium]|nr:GNAT family N-acetyltransferase [Acidobacteriota bacterium]
MQGFPRGPAYRIETRRLLLRCWNPEDAPMVVAAIEASLDHLQPWMDWAQQEPEGLEAKAERLRKFRGAFDLGQDFTYGIFTRDERDVIGGADLHTSLGEGVREIGYWIHKEHIRRGLATEAAAALTKVAFEVTQVQRVEMHCDPNNVASLAVPRKLGYVHEATLRKRGLTPQGHRRDTMVWTLLAEEYPGSPSEQAEIKAYDVMGRQIL